EQQAVFPPRGQVVQPPPQFGKRGSVALQLPRFFAGENALFGEIAPTAPELCRMRDPQDVLQIAQAAWTLLEVRLEVVGGIVEAGMALLLLEQLGFGEIGDVQSLRGG